jgi:hypothetical protein
MKDLHKLASNRRVASSDGVMAHVNSSLNLIR